MVPQDLPQFNRRFFDSGERLTCIGEGSLGGKAQGLARIHQVLAAQFRADDFPAVEVGIPVMTVIRTDVFATFLTRNRLSQTASSEASDDRIAHAFQRANLPEEIVGDLRALVSQTHTPLAVRSSSLLEDTLREPFAGIYATKMIPNNQPDADSRFQQLVEAIKLVYASTFFKRAKDYRRTTGHSDDEEKMAVIVQQVVGQRKNNRFYPDVAGVARSFNYYPSGHAKPQDGVVTLALGLGKTIVDGGIAWTYSPSYPKAAPPFGSASEWLRQTQTRFWAITMGKPPEYDPIRETEYLHQCDLTDAEYDGSLRLVASTYDRQSDRIQVGVAIEGPRIVTFAPILKLEEIPLNRLLRTLLGICEETLGPVEMEFALTFRPTRFGFLQVRPMLVSDERVDIQIEELEGDNVLLSSTQVLGNGTEKGLRDVVYVKPEAFDARHTAAMAGQLGSINQAMTACGRKYLLIGFGRWGSTDSWLGIPVEWGQIGNAGVVVEATLPNMDKELSQGSHFFHNLISFGVSYFTVRHTARQTIDWDWLTRQTGVSETAFVRHVRLSSPLLVKIDGRKGVGVVLKTL